MLVYLLKMITCSAAFYGLYALLFRNEKMLVFNRFYLLAALVVSFIIPCIAVTVYVDADAGYTIEQPINEPYNWIAYTITMMAIISILGSIVLLVRFTKNLLNLRRRSGKNQEPINFKGAKIILLDEPVVPHSFLNTIFLNIDEYQDQQIENEVLEHELAHVKQRHSWDILFIELLQIFCWFNPVIYLYKQSIKINHELLADAAVVKELDNTRSYQHILLQRAGAQPSLALASSFHFLITKKRIIMLQKKVNPGIAGLKAMLCLPLLALLVFIFSERVYAQVPPPSKPPQSAATSKGKPADVDVFIVKTKKGNKSEAIIKYKNGKEVSGDVSTPEKKKAFEMQYGVELPPPPPPPPPPTRNKKAVVPPPPPPVPVVTKVVSFAPPMIVKDEKVKEAAVKAIPVAKVYKLSPVAATKKVKRLAPPVIVKDDEVHKVIKESLPAEGVDKAGVLEF